MAIHATESYMNCLSRLDGKEIGLHICIKKAMNSLNKMNL